MAMAPRVCQPPPAILLLAGRSPRSHPFIRRVGGPSWPTLRLHQMHEMELAKSTATPRPHILGAIGCDRPTRFGARRHAWRVASESCGATPENRHAPVAKRRGWLTTTPIESMIRRSSFHRHASTTRLFWPRSSKETPRPTARRELRHRARMYELAIRRIPNIRSILRSLCRRTSSFAPRSLVSSAG